VLSLKESFSADFVLVIFLNAFSDWGFEVILLSRGVFDLEAHFGSEVRAREALLGLDFELVGRWRFIS
jgi:hypothetical protein|tara:strand:- start:137 stop:340 length:204 start_codon:yes stop_codon:yes gene_type:complete